MSASAECRYSRARGNNYLVSYKSVVVPLATHLLLSNDDIKGPICGVLVPCTVYYTVSQLAVIIWLCVQQLEAGS